MADRKLTRKERSRLQAQQQAVNVPKAKTSKNLTTVLAVIIAVLGVVLYANTIGHDYVLDDYSVIKENRIVQKGSAGTGEIFSTHYRQGYKNWAGGASLYRPLTLSVFAIQWGLSPDNPSLAHAFNILMYALVGVLLFFTFVRLFPNWNPFLPWVTVMLFMAHPIHTEVVANIKSLDELLSLALGLGSFLLILRYLKEDKSWLIALSALLFLGAFMAKESTITLAGVIALSLYFFRKPTSNQWTVIGLSMVIPTIIYLAARYSVLGSLSGHGKVARLDNMLVGINSKTEYFATAVKILGMYFGKLILPHPLSNDYSIFQIERAGLTNPWFIISFVLYAGMAGYAFSQLKKKSFAAYPILFFLGTLWLYANLPLQIGSSFGERFLFVPSIAFCLMVVWGLSKLLKVDLSDPIPDFAQLMKSNRSKVVLILAPVVLFFGFKTMDRNGDWVNNITLYETDVQTCPNSARLHYYYGMEIMKQRAVNATNPAEKQAFLEQAIREQEAALALYPGYADAQGQIALAYYRMERWPEAEKWFLEALAGKKNRDATLQSNLGSVYFRTNRLQEALPRFQEACRLDPLYLDAHLNMGSTLGTLGRFDEAIQYFNRCILIDPNFGQAYLFIGKTYEQMGQPQQAAQYLQRAKALGIQ